MVGEGQYVADLAKLVSKQLPAAAHRPMLSAPLHQPHATSGESIVVAIHEVQLPSNALQLYRTTAKTEIMS